NGACRASINLTWAGDEHIARAALVPIEVRGRCDVPLERVTSLQLEHVLRNRADAIIELAAGWIDVRGRENWEVARIVLDRERGRHLPAIAVTLGRCDVHAFVDAVVDIGDRDVPDTCRSRASVAHLIVRGAEASRRIGPRLRYVQRRQR